MKEFTKPSANSAGGSPESRRFGVPEVRRKGDLTMNSLLHKILKLVHPRPTEKSARDKGEILILNKKIEEKLLKNDRTWI